MIYSFDYDHTFTPSIPIVDVRVGPPDDEPSLSLTAIIDSGADVTIIPIEALLQISAYRMRKAWMRSVGLQRQMVDIYLVSLQLAAYEWRELQVIGGTNGVEAIIGRDVLNSLIVTLNGLAAVTEIFR